MSMILFTFAVSIGLTCLAIYLFPPIRICGTSMFPTFYDGDIYFGKRVFNKDTCEVGQVYVYTPPYSVAGVERYVVKRLDRVKMINGKTYYYFLGDNPRDSYDSRYYGYVSSKNVIAKIIIKGVLR